MTADRGSAEVVEMSFVLPVAMVVVVSLVYLAFAMFLYGHAQNLARITANEISARVGEDGLYWQLLGNYISDEDLAKIQMGLHKELNGCRILPGLSFESGCSVSGRLRQPVANVHIEASYFGKPFFEIVISQDVYKPQEFAETVDFGHSLERDFEELKGIYDSIF